MMENGRSLAERFPARSEALMRGNFEAMPGPAE